MIQPRLQDLIGVPFKNRGRSMEGLDCYGLVMEVYKRYNITLPEYNADYDDRDKISAIIKKNAKENHKWKKISKDSLSVPCVLAIRFGVPKGWINHTGVYIGNGKFIHTRDSIGVCVDRIDSPAWKGIIEGFYKFVGDT